MKHKIGNDARPLKVAIIGSGPSGFYTAEALLNNNDFSSQIDMFDSLPTPYGLVRAGVAPDHQNIKAVTKVYEKIAQRSDFRFWGNVEFGKDITKDELLEIFDVVIYAVGAQTDRNMNIPGENLPGSHSATEFVNWYNGHPDFKEREFDFSHENVAIIGMGNVAMDIARILARTADEFKGTDIASYAQKQLSESKIKNIYVFARRGPLQAAFTPAGTKEFPKLQGAVATISPEDLTLEYFTEKILKETDDKRIKQNLKFLEEISRNKPTPQQKEIKFLFRRSPMEVYGSNGKVEGIKLVKNELFENDYGKLSARATDVSEDYKVGLVFRSIGYRSEPLPDVSFDDKKGIIKNLDGRVIQENGNQHCKGEYVVGWAKRGPTGIIGTNKPDALETVKLILDDFSNIEDAAPTNSQEAIVRLFLKMKEIKFVKFSEWKILDEYEIEQGEKVEKPREKITSVQEMLKFINKSGNYSLN